MIRGQAYYKLYQFHLAMNDFAYCDSILKDESEYPYLIGSCYDKLDNSNKALFYYNKAITLDSSDIRYIRCRANLFLKIEKYDKAIIDYNTILNHTPKDGSIYYYRGIAEYKINDKKNACLDWNTAIMNSYTNAMYYISKHCVDNK